MLRKNSPFGLPVKLWPDHIAPRYVCFGRLVSLQLTNMSSDPSCILLPPKINKLLTPTLIGGISAALTTRFNVEVDVVRRCLRTAQIEQWGKICHVDSEAGDTMRASSLGIKRDDSRDATFVRVRGISNYYHFTLTTSNAAVFHAC